VQLSVKLLARTTEVGARTLVHAATAGPKSHGKIMIDDWVQGDKGLVAGRKGKMLQDRVWVELRGILEGIQPGVTKI
jgi:retinol dehydrogenase-12